MSVASVVLPDEYLAEQRKNLWFITGISNVQQWRARYNLYYQFRKHVTEELGCNLLTVECAIGGGYHCTLNDPCNPDAPSYSAVLPNGARVVDVRVRGKTWIWNKEVLQNVGVRHLPPSAETLVFCDGDIRFLDPNAIENTIYHLNGTFKVVQPFENCADLGPSGEIIGLHKSFGWCHSQGMIWNSPSGAAPVTRAAAAKKRAGYCYGGLGGGVTLPGGQNPWHPGYVIAMKKSTWQKLNGLLEVGIVGSGDHHMMTSLIGRGAESFPAAVHPNYRKAVLDWQKRAAEVVQGSLGWINGTITAGWHGKKRNRFYRERWGILTRNAFDPQTDVFHNSDGVLELAPGKPILRDEIQRYFRSRNEDEEEA